MENIGQVNEEFNAKKPKKKKGLLITAIIALIIIVALVLTYFLVFTRPQLIFSKAIDKIFGTKNEVYESIKVDYKIKASVETNNEEIEEYTKELEKCSLNFGSQIDVKEKQEIVNLGLDYQDEEVIKAQVYYDSENMYIYLNELFAKYIEIDMPEEAKESLEKIFEMTEPEEQKKAIKMQEILKDELKDQIKEQGEFEKEKATIKINGEEKKVTKNTLELSQDALIDIMINILSNLSENEEFLEYFETEELEDVLSDAAKELEENKEYIDEDVVSVKINLYTKGLTNKFVGADLEVNINDDSQNMKFVLNITKEDKDKYTYKVKMNALGVNAEIVSGIIEIQKEKDSKKEQEGKVIVTAKVAMAQLEAKLEIDYLAEYNKGIDEVDTSKSVKIEDIKEKDIESIIKKLKERPLIEDLVSSMDGGLFEKAEEATNSTKQAQIAEAIALAKADLLADYYSQAIKLEEITEEKVKEKIEEYLYEQYDIKVTKSPEKFEFTIIVDGIENKMTLDFISPSEGVTINNIYQTEQ